MRVRVAAITGATGFIGSHLAERLVNGAWNVRAIVRPQSRREPSPGVESRRARLLAADLVEAFRGADVVFHLAGATTAHSARAYHEANASSTLQVAMAAREAGARLVYMSSQAAAGPAAAARPRTEDDPAAPCSPYGVSKLAGERAVEEMEGLDWTILRPVAVYGPRDRGFLPLFKLARVGFATIVGSPNDVYTLIHVSDLVAATEAAACVESAKGRVLFVGHPRPHTSREVGDAIARAVGRQVRTVVVPRPVALCAAYAGGVATFLGRPAVFDGSKYLELTAGGFACSVSRWREVLGMEPRIDIEEGFAKTAEWYRENGWLRR
jgi:nucleoside-diphosphate-sugar epimerase